MTKKTEETITITDTERNILNQAISRANTAGRDLVQARETLSTAMTLIGDRYGVDLASGEYNIGPQGEILKVGQVAEGSKSGKQLLTEN